MNNAITTKSLCPTCKKLICIDLLNAEMSETKCSFCNSSILFDSGISEFSDEQFQYFTNLVTEPIVINFFSSWCTPCNEFSSIYKKVSFNFIPKAIFLKINTGWNPIIADSYGIKSIPTVLVIKNKLELNRISGTQSYEQIFHWIKKTLSDCKTIKKETISGL